MRHYTVLMPSAILCLMTSCIAIPLPRRIGIRGAIKAEALSFLEKGPATREEVLLHLGRPEDISQDQRLFDYKWIGAWDVVVIGPGVTGVSEAQKKCNILRFQFDELGTVENVYVQSYVPRGSLNSNEECHFDPTTATKLNFLPKLSADYTFIKEGQTSRQEVLQRLGWADVGLEENRLFWGRWSASSSGLASSSVLVMARPGIGPERARKGAIHNLVVEFDESAVVVRVANVKDEDIVRELIAWSQRSGQGPTDLSSLIRNSYPAGTKGWLSRHDGSMYLKADSIDFFDSTTHTWFKASRDDILSLKLKSKAGVYPSLTLKFKEKTAWGNEIDVVIDPPGLLTVLKFMTQKNP